MAAVQLGPARVPGYREVPRLPPHSLEVQVAGLEEAASETEEEKVREEVKAEVRVEVRAESDLHSLHRCCPIPVGFSGA